MHRECISKDEAFGITVLREMSGGLPDQTIEVRKANFDDAVQVCIWCDEDCRSKTGKTTPGILSLTLVTS